MLKQGLDVCLWYRGIYLQLCGCKGSTQIGLFRDTRLKDMHSFANGRRSIMYIANDGMTKRVWFILDTEKRVYQTVDLGSTLYGVVLTL